MSKLEIRKACREYAQKFVDLQRDEFSRLGIQGDWGHPYLTMSYDYEATIAREFGKLVAKGNVYKGLRPVLWCPHCQTALAEAEIEYEEHESPSIYVKFALDSDVSDLFPKIAGKKLSIVIWTTTPWTLPANLAVALHDHYDYVVIPYQDEYLIVAKQLLTAFSQAIGIEEPEMVYRFSGKKLENLNARHPFLPRTSLIVLSDHVTLDAGSGCVHIAPGHGEDDYAVGKRYHLKTLTPVDHEGRFTAEAGVEEWKGIKVFEANQLVIDRLKSVDALLKTDAIKHMYPHCWRCKNPVIFRATEQWFASLSENNLRAKALDAIRRVQWIPPWGRERIYGMIENRPDWCLSRQRSWGVPIIAFRCRPCGQLLLDAKLIESIAKCFETRGADAWFEDSADNLVPPEVKCDACDERDWVKEEDILDVWFDSGVSFASVLERRPGLRAPADLYLEGSDQHRGWFHSSLLVSIGTRDKAPYQAVLTHGFVVDGQGKKYSKSAGNYVPPDKVLKENGAEILRLWVAAEDYRNDIRFSNEIVSRLVEAYRKIRNTCRYLLGNLYDFDPAAQREVSYEEIDLWSLHQLQKLIQKVDEAYEQFNFHVIFHELNRYCTVDLSAFYLDILKDRLYTSAKDDPARRAAQKVLFEIVTTLTRLMAPILAFTSEEIWQEIPAFPGKERSVHLSEFPKPQAHWVNETLSSRWEAFREVRDEILKVLEKSRQAKIIGNSLGAKLTLIATNEPESILRGMGDRLVDLLQVSQLEWGVEISNQAIRSEIYPTLFAQVTPAEGKKCERCWRWSVRVGEFADHPTICERCHDVLK